MHTSAARHSEHMRLKDASGARRALSFAFLPFAYAYYEYVLASSSGITGGHYALGGSLTAAAAFGLLCSCVAFSPSSGRAGFAAALLFSEAGAFYFCLQFFINDSYQTFMDPLTIFQGAAGVMGEFSEDVADLIKHGYGYIALYHVPVLILLLLLRYWDFSRRNRWTLAYGILIGVFVQSMAAEALCRDSATAAKYTYEYAFSDGIKSFGLLTSTELSVIYGAFGIPEEAADAGLRAGRGSVSADAPAFYGLNKTDADFDALAAAEDDKAIKAVHAYVASQQASEKNAFTGMFKGKNLIFICAESFAWEACSPELTPTLYRMATKGIVFEDYYQPFWGGSTTSGEFAALTGLIPVNHANSMQQIIGKHNMSCIGSYLMPLGYTSTAYHNGSHDYYNRHKTHPCLGFQSFVAGDTGMAEGISDMWPPSDTEMIACTAGDWIDSSPFYVYYMTFSGHSIYNFTRHEQAMKHREEVAGMDASVKIQAYVASQLELEEAVSMLVDSLEEAGLLEDTLIVLTSDHYPYALQSSMVWGNDRDYLAELYGFKASDEAKRDHNRLIMWSVAFEDMREPIVVPQPCSSIDIVPTVLNLMGADFDSRIYPGRDLLSGGEGLVIWNSYSWKTERGFYDAVSGRFVPAEGMSADSAYIDAVKRIVRDKLEYCRNVLKYDYFKYVPE